MRMLPLCLLLAATRCAPQPRPAAAEPATPARTTTPPEPAATSRATAMASADATPTPPPAPTETSTPAALQATTAMPMDGNIDAGALVAAVNEQLAPLAECVALIRETDKVVGSLNLQVTAAAGGALSVELQSPVNDEAAACLERGMKSWHADAGVGRAMLLLQLRDQP